MIESHSREGDKPMEQHLHIRSGNRMFPTLERLDLGLWAGLVSLVVVLLPGIVSKLLALGDSSSAAAVQNNALLASPSFSNSTLLIAFILAISSIVCSKNNPSARLLATLTLVVCLVRFLLPS